MDEDKDKEDEEQDDLNKEESDALEAGRRVTKVRIIRVGSRPAFNPLQTSAYKLCSLCHTLFGNHSLHTNYFAEYNRC